MTTLSQLGVVERAYNTLIKSTCRSKTTSQHNSARKSSYEILSFMFPLGLSFSYHFSSAKVWSCNPDPDYSSPAVTLDENLIELISHYTRY